MIIFDAEKTDGLTDALNANASVSYASLALPTLSFKDDLVPQLKSIASLDDSDLYYVQSILVTSSWNKNDDIFSKEEVWNAKETPTHKPTNLEHDENIIIGHITANWPMTTDGVLIDQKTPLENLPDKFHIVTGSVIYTGFSNIMLKERASKLIEEIENGDKYVSMECFFKNFDYGLIDNTTGEYKILNRNESTAYLTKYLKAYGGTGEHENYRIGRVLKNITFSGKGFVNKPANPDSVIFNNENLRFGRASINNNLEDNNLEDNKNLSQEKIDDSNKIGVYQNQANTQENNIMSLEKLVAELSAKVDALAVSNETINTITSLKDQLTAAEMSKKEKEMKLKETEEALMKSKSEFDALVAQTTEAQTKANEEISAKIEALKSELVAAEEVIAAYKNKEADMMKKEKNMKRMASLIEKGIESETASATVDKLDSLSDEAFEAITNLVALAAKPMKMEDKAEKKETKAEEVTNDVSEALETVEETSETIDLSVGDETDAIAESTVENTRAALVDFVYSRLNKKSPNKGE